MSFPASSLLSPWVNPLAVVADPQPVDLGEASLDAASGLFGDLDAADILLEFARLPQPPYLLAGAGLAIATAVPLAYLTLAGRKKAMGRIGQTKSGLIEDALVVASGVATVATTVARRR